MTQDTATSEIVSGPPENTKESPNNNTRQTRKGRRFWLILLGLVLTSLLTSLEATITSTVLPVIVADLGGGDNYIWVANGYFLTMYASPSRCWRWVMVVTILGRPFNHYSHRLRTSSAVAGP